MNPREEQALMKAMAVYAEQRYQSMEEFHEDLYGRGVEITPKNQNADVEEKAFKGLPNDKKKLTIAVGTVGVVAIVLALTAVWGRSMKRQKEQTQIADTLITGISSTEGQDASQEEYVQDDMQGAVDVQAALMAYQAYMDKLDSPMATLVYIDNDSIPECYIRKYEAETFEGFELLSYRNGCIISILDANIAGTASYYSVLYQEKNNRILFETQNYAEGMPFGSYVYYELSDDSIGYHSLGAVSYEEIPNWVGDQLENQRVYYNGDIINDHAGLMQIDETNYYNYISSYGLFHDMSDGSLTVEEAYQELLERENQPAQENAGVHRYELFIGDVTWTQAYQDCVNRGGYLVHINSQEEFDAVTNQIIQENKTDYTFWIGARCDPSYSEHLSYRWLNSDGSYSKDRIDNASYMPFWLPGEPSYSEINDDGEQIVENCVDMFYRKSAGRFYWNDVPDDIISAASYYAGKIGYICEYED